MTRHKVSRDWTDFARCRDRPRFLLTTLDTTHDNSWGFTLCRGNVPDATSWHSMAPLEKHS